MRVDATTEPFIDVVQPNAELINTDDKYEHVLLGMNPAFEVFDGTQGVPPPVLDHNVQPPGQPYRAGEGDDQNHGSYDADQAIIGFTGHDDDYQGQGTFLQDTAQQVMVSEQAEAMHILTEQALPRHHQGMPQQVPAQQFIPPNILQQQPTVLDYAGTKNDSTAMSPPIYVTIGRQVADEQSTETDGQISWECLHDYNDLAPPLLPGSPPHCGASFASALSLLTHFCSQHRPVALGSAPLWTWCGGCGPTRGSSLTDTRCGQCGVIGGSRELWLYCMPVVPEDKLRFLLHDEARLMAEALDMATMMGSECADQVGPWHHNVGLASPEPVLLPDLVSSGTSTASSPTSMIGYASSAASSAALSSRNSSVATLVTGSASFGAAAGAGGDFGSGSAGVNAGDVPAYEKPDGAIGGGQQQHHQYHQHQVSAGEQTIEAERHLQQHYQHQQHCHYQQQHQQDQHQYESHQRQQPCQDPMQDRMHDMPSNGAQQTPNM
jgi:hypothetical protein